MLRRIASPQLWRPFATAAEVSTSRKPVSTASKKSKYIDDFPLIYPDFLPSPVWNRRDPLFEELQRADMMERRMNLDIPEFYVGSVMAVTISDPNMGNRQNRFVGICVRKNYQGLHHQFTLRNVVDGLGVEVMYEMYNPTILKIETIKLERRLDDDLSYLIDALPQYSTFDFHMEPVAHPAGTPVPINTMKVKLRPPPWTRRWEIMDFQGIEDPWSQATPWYKRKFYRTKMLDFQKYDIVQNYRDSSQELEHDLAVQDEMLEFEARRHRQGATRRRILRSVATATRAV
ncbi:Protein MRPL-19 [Aphelenchoides avenae]|nr:Protein MRPL-19 [Aphelenchus avenae]